MANPAMSRKRAAPGASAPAFDQLSADYASVPAPNLYMPNIPAQQQQQQPQQPQQQHMVPNNNNQLVLSQRSRGNNTGDNGANAMVHSPQVSHQSRNTAGHNNTAAWNTHSDQGNAMNENEIEALRDSAARIAKAKAGRKQIPPFVQKLAQFVNDPSCDDVIRWSDNGKSFLVLDEDAFSKNLIPDLFKHNNYASFVRQLNMYGFHKVVALSDGSMKTAEQRSKPILEYTNPYFQRDQKDLLWLIQKPKNTTKKRPGKKDKGRDSDDENSSEDGHRGYDDASGDVKPPRMIENGPAHHSRSGNAPSGGQGQPQELASIFQQLDSIKQHQALISSAIARLRKDHTALYEQSVAFQTLHDRHENSINHILSFLATVYDKTLGGHLPAPFGAPIYNAVGTPTVSPPGTTNMPGTPRGLMKRTPLLIEGVPGNNIVYQQQHLQPQAPPPSMRGVGANKMDNMGNAFPKMAYSPGQNYATHHNTIQELKSSPKASNIQSPANTVDTPVTTAESNFGMHSRGGTPATHAPALSPRSMSAASRQPSIVQDVMSPTLANSLKAHHNGLSQAGDDIKSLETYQAAQDSHLKDLQTMLQDYVTKNSPAPTPASLAPTTTMPPAPTPPAAYMGDSGVNDDLFGGVGTDVTAPDLSGMGFDWNVGLNDDNIPNLDNFDFTFGLTGNNDGNKITSAASSPETVDDDGRETKKRKV